MKEKLPIEENVEEPTPEEIEEIDEEITEKIEGQELERKAIEEKAEKQVEKEIAGAEKQVAEDIAKIEDKVEKEKISQKKAEKQIEKEVKEVVEEASEEIEEIKEKTEKTEEKAFGKREKLSPEEREKRETERQLEEWKPRTKLGKLVKSGKVKDIDKILGKEKILESEIVDSLLKLRSDLLNIGQAKGKFGGGKRRVWRQTQKKTAEGNVPTFACMTVVGDEKGYVGIGYGRAKETLPARAKALRNAKLNIIKVKRGCGSFDCICDEKHSIPFITKGRCGSSRIMLWPAPQGTGLAVGGEIKKILKLAGIKDVYSKTFGQTKTTFNLARACIDALKNLDKVKEK